MARSRPQNAPSAPQVGRRPPNPMVPLMSGLMWIVVGVIVLFTFHAGWHVVVGIVGIGVGGLFVRGGLVAARRQAKR